LESRIQQKIQCDSVTIDPGIEPSFSVTSAKETTSAFEDGHFFHSHLSPFPRAAFLVITE
jgi:hypothetical protein